MKMTLNVSQFRDEFRRAGRADQFSYDALGLIFDYFEDCDPDMEMDVIAICCEYTEAMPEEIRDYYSIEGDVLEYLLDHTSIAGITKDGAIIYAAF